MKNYEGGLATNTMSLHEEQGATLEHKCGKRDSSIALLYIYFLGLFWPFSFFYLGNALIMMIITLLLITT